jgi:hypothetical protein
MTVAEVEKAERPLQAKKSAAKIHIACEEMNFTWKIAHVKEFRDMWQRGCCLMHIAEYFSRPVLEIILLAADQAEKEKISERPGGMLGGLQSWKG